MTPNFIFYIYIYKQHFHLHCCFWCCHQHQHRHLSTVRHGETRSFEHSHGTLSQHHHQRKSTLPSKVPALPLHHDRGWRQTLDRQSDMPSNRNHFHADFYVAVLILWYRHHHRQHQKRTQTMRKLRVQKLMEEKTTITWCCVSGGNFHFGLWSRKL